MQADEVKQTWDPALYQGKHAFVWQAAQDLLGLLDLQPGQKILDVGCGTGQLTDAIAQTGAAVLGIDKSPEMIHQARQNFPTYQFEIADATDFDFGHDFDAVFSNAALHWITPPQHAAACMALALRPGGKLVVEFGGHGNVQVISSAADHAAHAVGVNLDACRQSWFFPTVGQYATMLESVGLEVGLATLFDRPTPLGDGEAGLLNWLKMFRPDLLRLVPDNRQEDFQRELKAFARPTLWHGDHWQADYRRLRVVAIKR